MEDGLLVTGYLVTGWEYPGNQSDLSRKGWPKTSASLCAKQISVQGNSYEDNTTSQGT